MFSQYGVGHVLPTPAMLVLTVVENLTMSKTYFVCVYGSIHLSCYATRGTFVTLVGNCRLQFSVLPICWVSMSLDFSKMAGDVIAEYIYCSLMNL